MNESRDKSITEAGSALLVDARVKCQRVGRAMGLMETRAERDEQTGVHVGRNLRRL